MKTMNRVPWVLLSLCILAVLAGGLLSGADDRGNEGAPHRAVNEAGMEIKNVPSPAAPVSGDVPEGGKNDEKGLRKEEKSPPPGPYVSIVIDDFGFSRSIADEYKDISLSLTWSIIPFQTHSAYAAELAEESGIPYMVHMPTYVIKGDEARGIKAVAPDLKSVADLPKYWELFKDPENPKKGRLLNGPAGWKVTSINEMKIKGYGLDKHYSAFSAGSETALSTAIKRAYDRGEPVLAYYWEPTWVMGLLDMTKLEEPPYEEKLWNDENLYACAIPSVRVLIVANTKFVEANPDIAAFLKNYTTTLEQNNKVLGFMFEGKEDTQKAAVWFLKNYEDVWKSWVPSDVAEKVSEALKGEK